MIIKIPNAVQQFRFAIFFGTIAPWAPKQKNHGERSAMMLRASAEKEKKKNTEKALRAVERRERGGGKDSVSIKIVY